MKILILGSGGMAGHIIYNNFKNKQGYQVYDAAREKVNEHTYIFKVEDVSSLHKIIDEVKPNIIINAVGVLVKYANQHPASAVLINAYFPHLLSEIAAQKNCHVIHLSTDCVFSGRKGSYVVEDAKDAEDFYGKSKALGELNTSNDLTIRTSIIGPEIKSNGTGLLHWYLNINSAVDGYSKVFWSGITTLQLCDVIEKSIANNVKGLIQISNNHKISKYNLLLLFAKYFKKDATLIGKEENTVHDKSLINSTELEKYNIPSYEQMLKNLSEYIFANKNIYKNIYPSIF